MQKIIACFVCILALLAIAMPAIVAEDNQNSTGNTTLNQTQNVTGNISLNQTQNVTQSISAGVLSHTDTDPKCPRHNPEQVHRMLTSIPRSCAPVSRRPSP